MRKMENTPSDVLLYIFKLLVSDLGVDTHANTPKVTHPIIAVHQTCRRFRSIVVRNLYLVKNPSVCLAQLRSGKFDYAYWYIRKYIYLLSSLKPHKFVLTRIRELEATFGQEDGANKLNTREATPHQDSKKLNTREATPHQDSKKLNTREATPHQDSAPKHRSDLHSISRKEPVTSCDAPAPVVMTIGVPKTQPDSKKLNIRLLKRLHRTGQETLPMLALARNEQAWLGRNKKPETPEEAGEGYPLLFWPDEDQELSQCNGLRIRKSSEERYQVCYMAFYDATTGKGSLRLEKPGDIYLAISECQKRFLTLIESLEFASAAELV